MGVGQVVVEQHPALAEHQEAEVEARAAHPKVLCLNFRALAGALAAPEEGQ